MEDARVGGGGSRDGGSGFRRGEGWIESESAATRRRRASSAADWGGCWLRGPRMVEREKERSTRIEGWEWR